MGVQSAEVAPHHSRTDAFRQLQNVRDVFFVSSLQNQGIDAVLEYLNDSVFKHVYLVGMTNCTTSLSHSRLAGKSSFLNQCIARSRNHVTIKHLVSLSTEGVELNREAMIADDHFDVDYSTTMGVSAIKLQNARFLLYDTPGVCPSSYRVRLLTTMLTEEMSKMKVLFPRKRLVPTVFSLHPDHSVLVGALAQIDYSAVDNACCW